MKSVIRIAMALVAIAGLSLAFSDNAPDRPRGVTADQWASISTTLGVVLVPDSADTLAAGPKGVIGGVDPTALIAPPTPAVRRIMAEGQPVRGYIMVKRGKLWRPLLVVPPTVGS